MYIITKHIRLINSFKCMSIVLKLKVGNHCYGFELSIEECIHKLNEHLCLQSIIIFKYEHND